MKNPFAIDDIAYHRIYGKCQIIEMLDTYTMRVRILDAPRPISAFKNTVVTKTITGSFQDFSFTPWVANHERPSKSITLYRIQDGRWRSTDNKHVIEYNKLTGNWDYLIDGAYDDKCQSLSLLAERKGFKLHY